MKIEDTQHFWHIMLYYFKKGKKTHWNAKKKTCAVYGEGAVTDQMCQKWFVKFIGTIDILAKQLFAVGLSYALEDI